MYLQAVAAELKRLQRSEALAQQSEADRMAANRRAWQAWLARYAARLRTEAAAGADAARRRVVMDGVNPRYVLRNWCAPQEQQSVWR